MRNSWIGLVGVMLLVSCGGAPEPKPEPRPQPAPVAAPAPALTGTITGKVDFNGEVPAGKPISMDAVPACAKQHKGPIPPNDILLNSNGTLRNVFVHLKTGVPAREWPTAAGNVLLDQQGCIYTPRVVAVRVGQTLEIGNADPMMHNVHPSPRRNPEWNEVQPPQGDKMLKTFAAPELMIPVACNMHPWMRAFVNVVEHPFFAVTGADGRFTFSGVPPGEYEIEAVHETLGSKVLTIAVGGRETREVGFNFRAK
jgi:plastocyanin